MNIGEEQEAYTVEPLRDPVPQHEAEFEEQAEVDPELSYVLTSLDERLSTYERTAKAPVRR